MDHLRPSLGGPMSQPVSGRNSVLEKAVLRNSNNNNIGGDGGGSSSVEVLPKLLVKLYTILTRIIQQRTLFDFISGPAMVFEDLQLLGLYFGTLMSKTLYDVPTSLAYTVDYSDKYRYIDIDSYNSAVFITFCCILIPHILLLALFYASEGSNLFRVAIASARVTVKIYSKVFYLPIMGLFLASFDCSSTTIQSGFGTLGDYGCLSSLRLPGFVMSIIGISIYFATAFSMIVFIYDSNPMGKTAMHKAHPRVDLAYMFIKTTLILIWSVAPDSAIGLRAISVPIGAIIMFTLHNVFYPQYNLIITRIRGAGYLATVFTGIVASVVAGIYAYDGYDESDDIVITNEYFYLVLIFVYVITYPIGYFVTGYLYHRKQKSLRDLVRNQASNSYINDVWTDDLNLYWIWTDPELAARFSVNHVFGRRQPFPQDFAEVRMLLDRGILEFPGYPNMLLAQANYLFHVTGHREGAYNITRKLDIRNVFFDTQLQLFIHYQAETKERELAFLETDIVLDTNSANEYSRIIRQAKLNHYLSLHHTRQIRRLVLDRKYEAGRLEALGVQLNFTSTKAEKNYEKLIDKFPESAALYRFYAHFAQHVLCDSDRVSSLITQAEMLENMEETGPVNDQGGDTNGSGNLMSITSDPNLRGGERFEVVLKVDGEAEPKTLLSVPKEDLMFEKHDSDEDVYQSKSPQSSASRSASNASFEGGRNKESLRLRNKLLEVYSYDMRLLLGSIVIIGIVALGVVIISAYIVNDLTTKTGSGLNFLRMLHQREYITALSLRRCRQLQDAYTSNDQTTFATTQTKFYQEMVSLQSVARQTFSLRDTSDPLTIEFYQDPVIITNISYYPQITKSQQVKLSLFQLMLDFSNSGIALATADFSAFANLNTNNDFRFIADNWYEIQKYAYDHSMNDLYFTSQETLEARAKYIILVLTVIQCLTFFVFITFLDVLIMVRFQKTQSTILNVFRVIPVGIKNQMFKEIDDAINEDELGFDEIFGGLNIEQKSNVRQSFRLQYLLYGCAAIVLSIMFAYLNDGDVYYVGVQFANFDQMGDMKTFTTRAIMLVNEIVRNDTQTWPDSNELMSKLVETVFDDVSSIERNVVYGDTTRNPPSQFLFEYLPDDLDPTVEKCLLDDTSLCQNVAFDPSIGFTKELITHGITHLENRALWHLQAIGLTAQTTGTVSPSTTRVTFLNKILEPYILGSWSYYEANILTSLNKYFNFSQLRNNLFVTAEVIIILLGQVFVFGRMYYHFKVMHSCNVEHIVRLPKHIRKLPEVSDFINQAKAARSVHPIRDYIMKWASNSVVLHRLGIHISGDTEDVSNSFNAGVSRKHNGNARGHGRDDMDMDMKRWSKNGSDREPQINSGGTVSPAELVIQGKSGLSRKRATFRSNEIMDSAEMTPEMGGPDGRRGGSGSQRRSVLSREVSSASPGEEYGSNNVLDGDRSPPEMREIQGRNGDDDAYVPRDEMGQERIGAGRVGEDMHEDGDLSNPNLYKDVPVISDRQTRESMVDGRGQTFNSSGGTKNLGGSGGSRHGSDKDRKSKTEKYDIYDDDDDDELDYEDEDDDDGRDAKASSHRSGSMRGSYNKNVLTSKQSVDSPKPDKRPVLYPISTDGTGGRPGNSLGVPGSNGLRGSRSRQNSIEGSPKDTQSPTTQRLKPPLSPRTPVSAPPQQNVPYSPMQLKSPKEAMRRSLTSLVAPPSQSDTTPKLNTSNKNVSQSHDKQQPVTKTHSGEVLAPRAVTALTDELKKRSGSSNSLTQKKDIDSWGRNMARSMLSLEQVDKPNRDSGDDESVDG